MTLKLVGAGLGRTGTTSLKFALTQLLDGPVYHMLEVFGHMDDIPVWHDALRTGTLDQSVLDDWIACVDWPACTHWKQIAEANPDAPILLSTRDDADQWFTSCENTILQIFNTPRNEGADPWRDMGEQMLHDFCGGDFLDRATMTKAYDAWNADVRATADPSRLIDWKPGDGWGPICEALGVPAPSEEFPHSNSTKEFRERAGWD